MKYEILRLYSEKWKRGRCYTGITEDLERRLKQHNSGNKSVPSTLGRRPFRLIHAEECKNRLEARKREKIGKVDLEEN